jgi:phage terminase large subunit GpA-like protein
MAPEPAKLHVNCEHCGAALTLQFKDWMETLEAASKPPTAQAWVCPACLKKNSGQFAATLGWVWKGHRTG